MTVEPRFVRNGDHCIAAPAAAATKFLKPTCNPVKFLGALFRRYLVMLSPFNESVFAAAIHFGLGIHEPSWTILCCTCNVKLSQADFQFRRHILKGVNDEHPTFLVPLTKRL